MEDTRAAIAQEAREAAFQAEVAKFTVKYEAMLALLQKPSPKTYADLPDHVRAWLEGKSAKELKELDATIDFVVSSRTAGKVLAYVGGIAVTVVTGSIAAAKMGWDLFSFVRGMPR